MPIIRKNLKKIKNILSKEQTQIVETAFFLMIPAILTKVTGQLFQLIIASYYGVEDPRLNQFLIANAIPELLTTVLMVGAVGTVIIPALEASKRENSREYFFKVYSSILNVSLLIFSIISLLLIIFANQVIPAAVNIVNPSHPISVAELNNIANMMRALILPQLILGISVFISTGLNVYDRYLLPQLSPLVYNIGRIGFILLLVPLFDKSPWAIVASVYIGSFLHLIIQLPLFYSLKFKYFFYIDFKNKELRDIAKTGLPRIAVLASDHIGLAVNRFLAYAFTGGPAALEYAKSLYLVIPSIFGYTFSYASYPTISRLMIDGNITKVRSIVQKSLNEITFLALPFIVVIMVLRVPLVRLFFGLIPGTQLTLDQTYQVAWILLWFSFGLIFITSRWFVFSLFYASKDTLLPSIVSMFSLAGVIGLSIAFTNLFSHNTDYAISSIHFSINNLLHRAEDPHQAGVGGISLAMSVVYTIEFFILLILFNKSKFNIGLRKLFRTIIAKFIAGAAMMTFIYFTYKIWNVLTYTIPEMANVEYRGSTTINLFLLTTITVIPGFMIYFLICHLLKVEELKIFKKYLNPVFRLGGLKIKDKEEQNK